MRRISKSSKCKTSSSSKNIVCHLIRNYKVYPGLYQGRMKHILLLLSRIYMIIRNLDIFLHVLIKGGNRKLFLDYAHIWFETKNALN